MQRRPPSAAAASAAAAVPGDSISWPAVPGDSTSWPARAAASSAATAASAMLVADSCDEMYCRRASGLVAPSAVPTAARRTPLLGAPSDGTGGPRQKSEADLRTANEPDSCMAGRASVGKAMPPAAPATAAAPAPGDAPAPTAAESAHRAAEPARPRARRRPSAALTGLHPGSASSAIALRTCARAGDASCHQPTNQQSPNHCCTTAKTTKTANH
eukprot:266934-Chlamydomonas_euryale.AAC.3